MEELGRDFFRAEPPLALGFPDRIDFAQHRPFTGPFSERFRLVFGRPAPLVRLGGPAGPL